MCHFRPVFSLANHQKFGYRIQRFHTAFDCNFWRKSFIVSSNFGRNLQLRKRLFQGNSKFQNCTQSLHTERKAPESGSVGCSHRTITVKFAMFCRARITVKRAAKKLKSHPAGKLPKGTSVAALPIDIAAKGFRAASCSSRNRGCWRGAAFANKF